MSGGLFSAWQHGTYALMASRGAAAKINRYVLYFSLYDSDLGINFFLAH